MHPKHERYPDETEHSWTHRYEMVTTGVKVLTAFSSELSEFSPPDVPEGLPKVGGWTIRFDGFGEYSAQVTTLKLESLAKLLDEPIRNLTAYVDRWEDSVSSIDPALQSYEIMPGDEDAIDSIHILLNRAIYLQQLVEGQLHDRHNDQQLDRPKRRNQ